MNTSKIQSEHDMDTKKFPLEHVDKNVNEFIVKKYNAYLELYEEIKELDNMLSFRYKYKLNNFLCNIKLLNVYMKLIPKLNQKKMHKIKIYNSLMDGILSFEDKKSQKSEVTSFRILVDRDSKLYQKYNIDTISIAVPSDRMGNRVDIDNVTLEQLPETIEIALFKKYVDMVEQKPIVRYSLNYNHPLCPDVLAFDSVIEPSEYGDSSLLESINELLHYDKEFTILVKFSNPNISKYNTEKFIDLPITVYSNTKIEKLFQDSLNKAESEIYYNDTSNFNLTDRTLEKFARLNNLKLDTTVEELGLKHECVLIMEEE